jgi:DNA-binding transcriptional ArsR family regulator
MMNTDFETIAKAIGHVSRLRILKLLERGEAPVGQVRTVLGLAPATVSKHLTILRRAGLVFLRQEGRELYCRLADHPRNPFVRPAFRLVDAATEIDPLVAADRRRLDELRSRRAA